MTGIPVPQRRAYLFVPQWVRLTKSIELAHFANV
jgi:hypothetical protein